MTRGETLGSLSPVTAWPAPGCGHRGFHELELWKTSASPLCCRTAAVELFEQGSVVDLCDGYCEEPGRLLADLIFDALAVKVLGDEGLDVGHGLLQGDLLGHGLAPLVLHLWEPGV